MTTDNGKGTNFSLNLQAITRTRAFLQTLHTVRTKEELAWALANTNEFAVEGDDELRAYAERVIESPTPLEAVNYSPPQGNETKITDIPVPGEDLSLDEIKSHDELNAIMWRRVLEPGLSFVRLRGKLVIAGVLCICAGAAITLLVARARWTYLLPQAPIPTPGNQSAFAQPPLIDGIVRLAWVAVALALIVAIYRLVTKAIDGDRNVELAWKITEKASGKLVIKKVPPQRKAR
jgi:hypothetical protein